MERSGYQKALKVISIITLIIAIIITLAGAALIFMGANMNTFLEDPQFAAQIEGTIAGGTQGLTTTEVVLVASSATIIGGVMITIEGIVMIIVGIFGLRGAKNPAKIGPFRVFAIIGLVLSILSLVVLIFGGGNGQAWVDALISLVMTILCVWVSSKIKAQAQGQA